MITLHTHHTYNTPTDNRFNYIVFYSHIIILRGTKKYDNIRYAGTARMYRADSITAFITSYSFPHIIILGGKTMIRFIDPVYRHPTHGRFYYILFYPHKIILIETKNDNFMYQ